MLGCRTRPLDTKSFEAFIIDAGVGWRQRSDLVHDLFWRSVVHRVTHAGAKITYNVPIRPSIVKWCDRLPDPLHPPFRIGKSAVLFDKTDSRENNVGKLSCLGKKDVLDNEEFKPSEFFFHFPGIWISKQRILTQNKKSLYLSFTYAIHHFHQSESRFA